jgi:glycosyltransferase involved in cell wall biosynthesis
VTPRASAARPVSLLIDARYLDAPGLGRYTREIGRRLLADPRFGPVTLAGPTGAINAWVRKNGLSFDAVRMVPVPARSFHPLSQAVFAWQALMGRLDAEVGFFPHYDIPLFGRPGVSVIAVHDLTHFRTPEGFPRWKRWLGGRLLRHAVRRADHVITGSRSAQDDISARFPGVGRRLETIPHGIDPFFAPPEPFGLGEAPPDRYLLCVGERKAHKNHRLAVDVLGRLHARGRRDLVLVLVGGGSPEIDRDLEAQAQRLGVSDQVSLRGRVADEELRDLYRHCAVLLFPSLYEGFGLPPLEAMACGAPVIASNRASLPEVVGDGGLLLSPDDPDAWANAVETLASDEHQRAELTGRGRARAARFSWDAAAERTAAALLQAAGRTDRERAARAEVTG